MKPLTRLQQDVFDFICIYKDENGFPPSYSDIGKHFNFSSDGTVRTYLEHLEKKGFIKRFGKARGIQILKAEAPSAIPIIGTIAAGPLRLAIDDHIGTIADIKGLQKRDGRFALQVNGDSMRDAGILNGDYAIIQQGVQVLNGQIAAILVDNEATLKRVYYEKDRIRLQPENSDYDCLYLNKNHFDATLIGRYIALIRQH